MDPAVAKGQLGDRVSAGPPGRTQLLLLRSPAMSCGVAVEALCASRAGSTSPVEALLRPMRGTRAKVSQSHLVSYSTQVLRERSSCGRELTAPIYRYILIFLSVRHGPYLKRPFRFRYGSFFVS